MKVDLNGPKEHPLVRFLKDHTPSRRVYDDSIEWDFVKFVVLDGMPVRRLPASAPATDTMYDIESYLNQGSMKKKIEEAKKRRKRGRPLHDEL